MKAIMFFIGLLFCPFIYAQYETALEVTDAPTSAIKSSMERNGARLLTELNNAQGEKRALSFKGIDMSEEAEVSLSTMWEVCPFRCDELDIIERCLNTASGFQVRNIPVIMEPLEGERFDEDQYQEIVLNFDRNGRISNLCFALNSSIYKEVMKSDLAVTDLRRRSLVLDFVEQFRTAYNRKDLTFLQDVFSDDALIITGSVRQRVKSDGGFSLSPQVEYKAQSKAEYLTNLAGVFNRNSRINVVFEDVKVAKHGKKDDIYGVKLVQHWNAGSYSDKGYLFLLWDFADEAHPKIHVRTWQPYAETPEDKVFGLNSFKVR